MKIRRIPRRVRCILLFLILFVFCTPTFASDYYGDAVNGSDESGDGSQANPWKKLQFAIDSITGTPENPHTIHLAPGHYGPGGSGDDLRIRLTAYINVYGSGIRSSVNYLYIGTESCAANHSIVSRLRAQFLHVNYFSENVMIENCIVYGASDSGIAFSNDSNGYIRNSIVCKCQKGLQMLSDCTVQIYNTVFYQCLEEFRIDQGADVSLSYCRMDVIQTGQGNISDDPEFLDAINLDFRLRKGSPCIDAGDPADPVPPGGGTRIDMGIHEYTFTPQLYIEAIELPETRGNNNGIPELNESGFIRIKLANGGEDAMDLTAQCVLNGSDMLLQTQAISYPDLLTGDADWPVGTGTSWSVPIRTGWCFPAVIRMDWTSTDASGSMDIPINLHSDTSYADSSNGSDLTGSGSPDHPYRTIGRVVRQVEGSRWMPVTIRARPGVYSPSSNGEVYPVYFQDYESLEGSEIGNTILDNDNQPVHLLVGGVRMSLSDLTLRSDNPERFRLVEVRGIDSEIKNTYQERDVEASGPLDYCTSIYFGSSAVVENNTFNGSLFETGFSNANRISGNSFSKLYVSSGSVSENHTGFGQFWFGAIDPDTPLDVRHNEIEQMQNTCSGYYTFLDNYVKGGMFYTWGPDPRSQIVRNVMRNTDIAVVNQSIPFSVTHNLMYCDRLEYPYPSYWSTDSQVLYYNNIGVYLTRRFENVYMYSTFMSGVFSMDHSLAMATNIDANWNSAAWGRHGISYYNMIDSIDCERASYSDLPGCTLPTNLDVEPGIRGSGMITEIGPGYLIDDTASWIPGDYRGLPVNPAILRSDRIFRCEDNDETTLYFLEDPSESAEVGDTYFLPDFELRRITDGYAYDSPLIDAGNPEPAYNDPDGTRCDIGPWGGPLSRTPLPRIPTWPPCTPTPAASPTASPTPLPSYTNTPSATTTPGTVPYELLLNDDHFDAGDPFDLSRRAVNSGAPRSVFEIIVLDVYGSYYFWPEWTPELQGIESVLLHGVSTIVVLQFTWPSGDVGHASNLWFWGGCVDPANGSLITTIAGTEFAY